MFNRSKSTKARITRDFIELFKKAFPNIDGDQLNSIDLMIEQFRKRSLSIRNFQPKLEEYIQFQITKKPDSILLQGDIIDNIPIFSLDEKGDLSQITGPAVVLSASCDCENDDTILLAGCITFSDAKEVVNNPIDLRNNLYCRFFCFNNSSDDSRTIVADFSNVGTFSKNLIQSKIESRNLTKIGSLTQLGYYFFITKLYIHLLRIENSEAINIRAS